MRKSKLFIVFMAIVMMFTLAACGTNNASQTTTSKSTDTSTTTASSDSNTTTASSAAADTGLQPEKGASLLVWDSKEEIPYIKEMAKAFTAKYNIPVKTVEVGAPDQIKKLTTDGPAGIGADVVIFPHDQLGKAVKAGLIMPNDYYGDVTSKENQAAAVQAVSIDGMIYGYPRSVETYALFYNKDLVKNPPKTFQDIIDFAKTYNDPKNNKYAIMWEMGNFYFSYPFLSSFGGYVFGKNGTDASDIGLANAGAVQGATFFQSLKKSLLPLKSGDVTYDIKKGLFSSGTVAMDINGPWTIADYKKAKINFGVVPIPTMQGKPAISFSGVKAWYVNAFTKYPNASKLFARFIDTKEAQIKLYQMTGNIPSNILAAEDPAIKGDAVTSAFIEQFKNSQPMPSIPEMGNVWGPIGAALGDIWDKGTDPKTSLDKAVKQIQDASKSAK